MLKGETAKPEHTKFGPGVVRDKFIGLFGKSPLLFRSPGRINLIGEHTDYNEGFVMPAAIDREMIFAISASTGEQASLHSLKHDQTITFDIGNPARLKAPMWANYMLGVVRRYADKGHTIGPFNCVVDGDIPTGAGLSSSAALECGFAFALNALFDLKVEKIEMVHIAQWAEHHYVGVMCGIMDQFASMMGAADKAFVLDCRSLSYQYFSLDLRDYTIVLCDTLVKHSLEGTEYNTRRAECESGVRILKRYYPEIKSLRDVTIEMLQKHRGEFEGKIFDRCKYVVEENQRVLAAADDLAHGNLKSFGDKMYGSHEGLSKLYEVSCPELDFLVDIARKFPDVIGSRMMGGGFGGCTINIVAKIRVADFVKVAAEAYKNRFNTNMEHYVVALRPGTSAVTDVT
ncbi:MAG TPA: galactokinase [Chryseolinea sp.]|nr:galactokinase [Chryseolinea sp.]